MATRNVDVAMTPANLAVSLSLMVGTVYTLQNIGASGRVFVREAAVMPTGGALRGFVIAPFGDVTLTPKSGLGVWVWTDRADGAKAVISEAV